MMWICKKLLISWFTIGLRFTSQQHLYYGSDYRHGGRAARLAHERSGDLALPDVIGWPQSSERPQLCYRLLTSF